MYACICMCVCMCVLCWQVSCPETQSHPMSVILSSRESFAGTVQRRVHSRNFHRKENSWVMPSEVTDMEESIQPGSPSISPPSIPAPFLLLRHSQPLMPNGSVAGEFLAPPPSFSVVARLAERFLFCFVSHVTKGSLAYRISCITGCLLPVHSHWAQLLQFVACFPLLSLSR